MREKGLILLLLLLLLDGYILHSIFSISHITHYSPPPHYHFSSQTRDEESNIESMRRRVRKKIQFNTLSKQYIFMFMCCLIIIYKNTYNIQYTHVLEYVYVYTYPYGEHVLRGSKLFISIAYIYIHITIIIIFIHSFIHMSRFFLISLL